jgi:hypothetical protein
MDPATIGLIISIAPTILDLLFGDGNHNIFSRIPKMSITCYGIYGYGEGLDEGEGFPYPELMGPAQPVIIKKGVRNPRTGAVFDIKRYVKPPDEVWAVTYYLNKKGMEKNKWIGYATKALQEARKQYYADEIGAAEAAGDAVRTEALRKKFAEGPKKRTRHGLQLRLLPPEVRQKYEGMTYEQLLPLYYEKAGKKPTSKTRKKYAQILVPVAKK